MPHQIVVEFPDEKTAAKFCGQLSDGFGENFCDFRGFRQKPDTKGHDREDYEEVTDDAGRRVFFVTEVFPFEEPPHA